MVFWGKDASNRTRKRGNVADNGFFNSGCLRHKKCILFKTLCNLAQHIAARAAAATIAVAHDLFACRFSAGTAERLAYTHSVCTHKHTYICKNSSLAVKVPHDGRAHYWTYVKRPPHTQWVQTTTVYACVYSISNSRVRRTVSNSW